MHIRERVLHNLAQLSTDNMLDQELPVGLLSRPHISLLMSPAIGTTDLCTARNVHWGKTHYNEYNIVLMNMHNLPSPCTCQISFSLLHVPIYMYVVRRCLRLEVHGRHSG